MNGPLVVIGDALLDRDVLGDVVRIAPDAPVPVLDELERLTRPGGASLAATLATAWCDQVILIAAIGSDEAGAELRTLLGKYNVELIDLGSSGQTPEKIRLRADDQSLLRLDRGRTRGEPGAVTREAKDAVLKASAVLVSDYGRGMASLPEIRSSLASVRAPIVFDPHPSGATVLPEVQLVTPSVRELPGASSASELHDLVERSEAARRHWQANGVALTLGSKGAIHVCGDGPPLVLRARAVETRDVLGAGDCFAAAATAALADGAVGSEAVLFAVEHATRFVEQGAASSVFSRQGRQRTSLAARNVEDPVELARAVRAGGGTVVAAGGCFDLLHAGHITFLQAARKLGDRLIVCLNSDDSVRALKGPDRPFVFVEDRKSALEALESVDAVVVFEEPTTERVLRAVRPHVFAKGGDYARGRLPEQDVLDEWNGQCVVLPFVEGHSSSRLLEVAKRR